MYSKKYICKNEWYKILKFCKPYFQDITIEIVIVLLVIFIGSVVSNVTPLFWGQIIDHLTNFEIKSLVLYLLLYFISIFFIYFLSTLESVVGAKLDYKIQSRMRKDIFDKILNMKCSELDSFDTGELISHVTSDTGNIVSFTLNFITSIITISINIIASLIFSFQISTQLTFLSIAFIPLSILSNYFLKRSFRQLNLIQKKYTDKTSSFYVNSLGHIPDLKSYRIEKNISENFVNLLKEGWNIQKKGLMLNNKSSFLSMVISTITSISTIIYSAFLILQHAITIGSFVSFQTYIDRLNSSIFDLLQMNYSAQAASVSIDHIEDIFNKQTEESDTETEKVNVDHISSVEFNNLQFSYNDIPLLNNICFNISAPGVYAIVGKNGSGKTTILKLMMKYYSCKDGSIKINKTDINTCSTLSIRRCMGYYSKDIYIQSDTILNNLLLGSEYYGMNIIFPELIVACQRAQLMDFIENLPLNFYTLVGENGKLLSSGQKQKIAIVRAILSKSSVLLFDEITSDLDGEVERDVIKILDILGRDKIVILVTHKVQSLVEAKKIFLIGDGYVKNEGTHEQLLKTSEQYRLLFES